MDLLLNPSPPPLSEGRRAPTMTIKDALVFGAKQLKKIDSAALDASILLCEAIKKPKEFLYTYPEKKLTPAQIKKYKNFISRRTKHEPIAYITGEKEFYGFKFLVSPAVLIPRPDTETIISAVLSTVGGRTPYSIIDIGTGSGTIAVTLKKLLPKIHVFASDVSFAALNLTKKNARHLGAKIIFKKGNLLSPFFSHPTSIPPSLEGRRSAFLSPSLEGETQRGCLIITANLPYLSRAEWQKTAPEVKKYEPYGALVGGKTGTEIYEKLFKELFAAFACNSRHSHRVYLFIEIGHNQKSTIAKLAKKILHPQKIEFFKDLAGKWRVAKIEI